MVLESISAAEGPRSEDAPPCDGVVLSILIVDDDPIALKYLQRILGKDRHRIATCRDGEEAIALLGKRRFDLVLADLRLGAVNGLDVLTAAKAQDPETEVVILTGHGSISSAIEAMRRGAFHYLEKPIRMAVLRHTTHQVGEKLALLSRLRELEGARPSEFPTLIGNAPGMVRIKELIRQIQDSDSNVLITGETGTGKELVARAVHQSSRRRSQKLLAINCASLTDELVANELFGHEKGAYTGATGPHAGLLECADGGTLFLDEVGDMSPTMQAKLLRVVQEGELLRVGGTKPVPVDLRIIAATNRDLMKLCAAGFFRSDLYYRLNVIGLRIPNLSERREDIPLLAASFLRKFAARTSTRVTGFSRDSMDLLTRYGYPGNVRELENIVEHATSMAKGDTIQVEDLPADLTGFDSRTYHPPGGQRKTLREVEMDYILWVLDQVHGKRTEAARILGIDRASLYRKLKRAEFRD